MSVCGGCSCCSSFYKYFFGIIPDIIHNIPKIKLKCTVFSFILDS